MSLRVKIPLKHKQSKSSCDTKPIEGGIYSNSEGLQFTKKCLETWQDNMIDN